MKASVIVVLSVTLAALSACTFTSPRERIVAATSQLEYALPSAGDAVVSGTIRNQGRSSTSLTGCPEPPSLVVEQHVDGRWVDVMQRGRACYAIYGPRTTELSAGATTDFAMSFSRAGLYRFRIFIGPRWGDPDDLVYTNEFTVR